MEIKDKALHAQLERQIADAAKKIKSCWEKEEAFCVTACPFHYDIREFNTRLKRGSFSSAYRLFANGVGFPEIVTELCDQPCQGACVRKDQDAALEQKMLEAAALKYTKNNKPNSYYMPMKEARIAIIGAGLSGLGCALRLCNKKYHVSIFEQNSDIGGQLWQLLSPETFLNEFERQFMYETYELHLNTEITDLQQLSQEFDAVYIATGSGGQHFGLLSADDARKTAPMALSQPGIFCGGSLCGGNAMEALAQGLHAATIIESYIKTGNMKGAVPHPETKMHLDADALAYIAPVTADEVGSFTKAETQAEAERCIGCRCDACFRHCPMMQYFQKFPLRIEDEVHVTIYPGTLDGDGTVATRLIASCNQCGLCREACPQDIDVGDYLRKSHQYMQNKGSMPWVFHDFWLRDMANAHDAESFAFAATPVPNPEYLYFPGCQLPASEPQYVTGSYSLLLKAAPASAIMLDCCGAPAVWAGETALQAEMFARILQVWQAYGNPVMVLACPSCLEMFGVYLPEIETVFLLDLWAKLGIKPTRRDISDITVFDPCVMAKSPGTKGTVRQYAKDAGFALTELPEQGQCCSFGGQVDAASPGYAGWLVQENTKISPLPYLVYCSNCRDVFAGSGKDTTHVLELFEGCGREGKEEAPGIEKRRLNRRETKRQICQTHYPDLQTPQKETPQMQLDFMEGVAEKLNKNRIFIEEVAEVIKACESDKRRIRTPEGRYCGYRQIGHNTLWVEYLPGKESYTVYNAYAHRMHIEKEG